MTKILYLLSALIFYVSASPTYASPDRIQLAVWANEAIVATYTYDYKNYIQQQKEIAKYFTADGWVAYSNALNASKLPNSVQKNLYEVTAVATQPPKLITLDPTHWQAIMTILVIYKNPQYQQQQHLKVTLGFSEAPAGQGVRGFNVTSLQSVVTEPPCQCKTELSNNSTGGK